MELREKTGKFDRFWSERLEDGQLALAWLGQAGFAIRIGSLRILIDPYLSDSLAIKYRDAEFPHRRMMPSPVAPEALQEVDCVLCTHKHTDHMDPATLPVIAANNPACVFAVPAAEARHAISIGLPANRLILANAGGRIPLGNLEVRVLAAAHETLRQNDLGEHHFLGYTLKTQAGAVYHSGDCVPYEGLVEAVRESAPDIALLPVNGRDDYRASRGVPGNMTFAEARQLCFDAGIQAFVPHHFGMFDFNTIPIEELREQASRPGPRAMIPSIDSYFILTTSKPDHATS